MKELMFDIYKEGNNSAQMPEDYSIMKKDFDDFWERNFKKRLAILKGSEFCSYCGKRKRTRSGCLEMLCECDLQL